MTKVSKINQFDSSHFIKGFSGKNYQKAVEQAKQWESTHPVEIHHYYEQVAHGKSILVSFEIKEIKNENN